MRKSLTTVLVVGSALCGLTLHGVAQAKDREEQGEKKVSRSTLPAAVQKTAQTMSQGATVKGFTKEKEEDGSTTYEMAMVVNGHTKDVEMAPDGTVNVVEEEVSFDSLPGAVKSALTAKAAGAKIVKVESLTKKDKVVAYEAATVKGKTKGEVQVGPNGETLNHEE
jgi:hypothetical protein